MSYRHTLNRTIRTVMLIMSARLAGVIVAVALALIVTAPPVAEPAPMTCQVTGLGR